MAEPRRIAIDWRVPPSEVGEPRPVVVPVLTAQPADAAAFAMHEAVLAPSARYALAPREVAEELGVDADLLPRVEDPLFPGLDLRLWRASCAVKVFGKGLGEHLLVRLPLALDASGRLRSIVLGERFFHQVRVHLEPDREDASWIEQCRELD